MDTNAKIYVAGHRGLVGFAIMRKLQSAGFANIITRGFTELDLRVSQDVEKFFFDERPEFVFLAAAKVGGIKANMDYPASFIYDNLMITSNVLHAAYKYGVKKLLFLGSSCIYPRECSQPILEEYLLTGPLETTNEPYALAKIAGIKMCQAFNRQYGTYFIAAMPTNLYGPNDNFDLMTSHVAPALIAKMHQAKIQGKSEVVVWGTGKPKRELLFVDDLADALLFLMQNYDDSQWINVGTGQDLTIEQLALTIKEIVGYEGSLVFDTSKPDGTPRKVLNVDRLHALGWKAETSLKDGLQQTYDWYLQNNAPMVKSAFIPTSIC